MTQNEHSLIESELSAPTVFVVDDDDGMRKGLEFLLKLYRTPGIRVSFLSGGAVARNDALMEQLNAEIDRRSGEPGKYRPAAMGEGDDLEHSAARAR